MAAGGSLDAAATPFTLYLVWWVAVLAVAVAAGGVEYAARARRRGNDPRPGAPE